MSAEPIPLPSRHPDRPGVYLCQWCGQEFRPSSGSLRRFCSRSCSGRFAANVWSERRAKVRAERVARPSDPEVVRQVIEECRAAYRAAIQLREERHE